MQGNNYWIFRHFSQGNDSLNKSITSIYTNSNKYNKPSKHWRESQGFQLSTKVSAVKNPIHTQEFLTGGKQLQCIWYSRVNFLERKTTLRCLECKKGFCRNHFWSHHIVHGGVPVALKYERKKRKRVSIDWEWSENLFLFFGRGNFYGTTHCLSCKWEMTLSKAYLQLGQQKRGGHSPLGEQTHRLWLLLQKELFSH